MTTTEIITLVLQGVIVPLVIWGIYVVRNYLSVQIENVTAKRILMQAADAAQKAVSQTMQTYVDNVKNTPDWNIEAQRLAFAKAKNVALEILGEEGCKLLQNVVGDTNAYLEAAIEAAVAETKEG